MTNSTKNNNKFKTFLYAGLSNVRIGFVGQLGLNEVFAILDSFSIQQWKFLFKNVPDLKRVSAAYLLILIVQIISDVFNHTSTLDLLRGWAAIGMAILLTAYLSKLIFKSTDLIIYFFWGEIVSLILFGRSAEGVALEDAGFFKFRLIPILNDLILIIAWALMRKKISSEKQVLVLFIFFGLFNLAFDARSNGISWILTAFILWNSSKVAKLTLNKALPYVALLLLLFQGLYSYYVSAVLNGNIGGEHTKEQLELTKDPYNPINLLIAGRAETFAGIQAVKDNPWIGYGSWAKDLSGKYQFFVLLMHKSEEDFSSFLNEQDATAFVIPSHSVIVGIWLYAGVIAFVAIMYIMVLFLRRSLMIFKIIKTRDRSFLPVVVFFTFNGLWTFLFSPVPHIKETLPIMIAFILTFYRKLELASYQSTKMSENNVAPSYDY